MLETIKDNKPNIFQVVRFIFLALVEIALVWSIPYDTNLTAKLYDPRQHIAQFFEYALVSWRGRSYTVNTMSTL